jgi:3-methyladenine DNA glycosylase Tag
VTFGRDPGVQEVSRHSYQAMTPFTKIFARAATPKGGEAALEWVLATTAPQPPAETASTPDDPILAEATRRTFCTGFSSKVIDDKWPTFETGFGGFDPSECAFMLEEHFDRLLQDRGIVRNGATTKSVQINAQLLLELKAEHGSAARFFANRPDADYVGLLDVLKKHANHLDGDAVGRFLRPIGEPAFFTSPDMRAAVVREGTIDRAPTGKREVAIIQTAFNQWSVQSGRDLTAISRILAMTLDPSETVSSGRRSA